VEWGLRQKGEWGRESRAREPSASTLDMIQRAPPQRIAALLTLLAVLVWGRPSAAHAAPHSFVLLDFRSHDVEAELRLPVPELATALRRPIAAERAHVVEPGGADDAVIRAYVAQYLHAETPKGAPWAVALEGLAYRVDDEVAYVVVHARLTPPTGESAQVFVLDYDVIAHEVVNHTAWVAVRGDFANGIVRGPPSVIGVIRYLRKSLLVDRTGLPGSGGNWSGFRATFHLGLSHIAEGTDHLLFLLALLLPAPLLVRPGHEKRAPRWGAFGGGRRSLANLLKVVTAFTLGHSITLLSGTLGWLHLAATPIEVLIAFSILVSAIHAARPLFAGREAWVAAGFGLVHGMAFASALSELHLDPLRLALAVLGFNLGIEAMQLFVIGLSFPWLVLLARTRAYTPARWAGALFAGSAALGWIGERALQAPNPMNGIVNGMAGRPFVLVATLAVAAMGATLAASAGAAPVAPPPVCTCAGPRGRRIDEQLTREGG
jgi:hypothetical protein